MTSNHHARTLARLIGWLFAGVLIILLTLVASLFLYVASVPWEWLRVGLALIFVVAAASLFVFIRPRWNPFYSYLEDKMLEFFELGTQ